MKHKDNENEELLHCKNCDGYYDPSLPNCPHCGEETSHNLQGAENGPMSVTQYGGGFGEAGSALSRAAMLIIAVLLMVALVALIVLGAKALSLMSPAPSSDTSVVEQDPADSSAPGDTSADASVPAVQPEQQEEEPVVTGPESFALDYYDLTLAQGESYQLKLTATPDGWEGEVTWTTDNQYVATVAENGTVTNVGGGQCTVTVSAGEASVTCIVRCQGTEAEQGDNAKASVAGQYPIQYTEPEEKPVQEPEPEPEQQPEEEPEDEPETTGTITLQYYDITLVSIGDGYTFKPSGGNGSYTWSIADPSIASVDSNGTVIAKSYGETTLTCTSGSASVTVIIRVGG